MSLKKNIIFNFILTSSTIIFPLITFPYITRTLSNVNIGRVFYIDAFTQYFILFSAIGIPYYGVREIAKYKDDKAKTSNLVIELVTLQLILSIIFCGVFVAMHFFIPTLKNDLALIKTGCIAIVANSFLIEWFYQGIGNFSYITIRSLITKAISVILILFLIKSKNDFDVYYLLLSITILISSILNFSFFLKEYFVNLNFKFRLLRHLKPLLVLFSINISISLYTVMDTIILGSIGTAHDVSFYNVPLKLVKVFWMIMGGIGTVLIPRMSSLFAQNDFESIKKLTTKSLSIVLLLGIPFCFFLNLFPTDILHLASGEQYLGAYKAMQILSIIPLIIGVCNVFGTQYLLPIGQERKILYATIIGFFISIFGNFVLIPYFHFLGAAITCVLSESAVCIVMFYYANKTLKVSLDISLILLILISILVTSLCYFVTENYISSFKLMTLTFGVYCITFLTMQLFVVRNSFLNEFLNFSVIKKKI